MNIYRYLLTSIVLFGVLYTSPSLTSQTVTSRIANSEIIFINPEMHFEISMDKTEYLQLEPISIRCKFTNETDKPQTTIIPSFLKESWIEVDSNGKSKQFDRLSIFTGLLRREPITFDPGSGFGEEITLETSLGEFFPEPGTYNIRLIIAGLEGKLIRSNTVQLTIVEPKGIDKKAFDFIKQNKVHERHPILAIWNDDVKLENGKTLLEEFVSSYGGSIYGEYAIYHLGNYYFAKGEYEKAKIELAKLRNSKNPRINKNAKSRLTDVEKYCPTILPKDPNKP